MGWCGHVPTCTTRTYRRQLAISLEESKNRTRMSPYRWFIPQKPPTTRKPYLPDSSKEASQKDALEVEAANQCVEEELGRKRRGTYNYYDPELRAKIGKYAATSGNKAAVNKFSKEMGKPISESTVYFIVAP